ncbi:unnamed protein product [Mytilus coruscus]|uniref:Uncharacterized protein n=1 Tax=Mytilus coruscus TaxID=42192 RepID=A0A6J8ARZ2_MYTCO|nr:unnamed protein product [Mytilus coruscus]
MALPVPDLTSICLFMAIPFEFYLNELRNPTDFYNNEFARTGGMSAFMVSNGKVTIGEYKPINEPESTELQIQDNDKTDPMVTDKKASTLGKTITTTKPASTDGSNAAGRLLTITIGLIGAVLGVILMYKAIPIVQKVQNMKLLFADEKTTRKEAEEQLTDSVTIEMSDEDGERIFTKGVNTRNIPPNCHMDIIE